MNLIPSESDQFSESDAFCAKCRRSEDTSSILYKVKCRLCEEHFYLCKNDLVACCPACRAGRMLFYNEDKSCESCERKWFHVDDKSCIECLT